MNKLEDFTEGSEWMSESGCKLKFHSFDREYNVPLFTCDEEHPYRVEENGTIGFVFMWRIFEKVDK